MAQAWVFNLRGWDAIGDPLPQLSSFSPEEARQSLVEAGYFAEAIWYGAEPAWHGTGNRISMALYSADPTTLQQPPYPFLVRLGTAFRWWPIYTRDLPSVLELLKRLSILLTPSRGGETAVIRSAPPTNTQREIAHLQELLAETRRQRDQLERQVEAQRLQLAAAETERAELRWLLSKDDVARLEAQG
jgi:hypothetical protein